MNYDLVYNQLEELMKSEYIITILSNTSSLIMQQIDRLNWAGFYLYRVGQLILGPFQGLPACEIIPIGKGVCGTAADRKETVLVKDVHQFPGHIACDSNSNSEIVVPITVNGELFGVLDIDSPVLERFDEPEKKLFERFVRQLEKILPDKK